jgi:hypothetical protein
MSNNLLSKCCSLCRLAPVWLTGMLWVLLAASLSAQAPTQGPVKPRQHGPTSSSKAVVTRELKLVDSEGHVRILLTTDRDQPVVRMFRGDGKPAMVLALDGNGNPSVQLHNPNGGASAILEIDDKGTHLKMDHPGGASIYLFLNDAGVSGLVLEDQNGKKRYEILKEVNTEASVTRLDAQGKPLP